MILYAPAALSNGRYDWESFPVILHLEKSEDSWMEFIDGMIFIGEAKILSIETLGGAIISDIGNEELFFDADEDMYEIDGDIVTFPEFDPELFSSHRYLLNDEAKCHVPVYTTRNEAAINGIVL